MLEFRCYRVTSARSASIESAPDKAVSSGGLNVRPLRNGEHLQFEIETADEVEGLQVELEFSFPAQLVERIFCNGFQSWTTSREYSRQETTKQMSAILRPFAGWMSDHYHRRGRRCALHSWSYCYLRLDRNEIVILGSLGERYGFTRFEIDFPKGRLYAMQELPVRLSAGTHDRLHLYSRRGALISCFDGFAAAYRQANSDLAWPEVKPSTGWTSWYNYYTDINDTIIKENLANLRDTGAPIGHFQIDDGFQDALGDWGNLNKDFPNGFSQITGFVRSAGASPGLWLAPFVCEKKSQVFRDHPDWLLRDHRGKPAAMGYNPLWNGWFYALDTERTDVQDYVREFMARVFGEWGFQLVKADFLYAAAALPSKLSTAGAKMFAAMQLLREAAGRRQLLGCGVPLASSFGLVDYCRIGSDIHSRWEHTPLKWLAAAERLSTVNSLTSTIGRAALSGRFFGNDPDVFVLRRENTHLHPVEKNTLQLVNCALGDLVFTSDNVGNYDQRQKCQYLAGFPHQPRSLEEYFQIGDIHCFVLRIERRRYLILANLSSRRARFQVEQLSFHPRGELLDIGDYVDLAKRSALVLYLCDAKEFELLGSNNHIFPGADVQQIKKAGRNWQLRFHPQATASAQYFFHPPGLEAPAINGVPLVRQRRRLSLWLPSVHSD